MDDKNTINPEERLIKAGRGIPKDQADSSMNNLSKQAKTEQPDNLDERIRKAGA